MGFWCTINKSYLNHTWSDSCSFSVVHCSGHPCCRWIIALSIPYNLMYKDATSTTTRRHSSGIYRSCCFWRISPKSNKNEGRMAIKCFNFLFNSYANVFQWAAYSRQFAFQGALICLCTVGNMSKSAIWEGISTLGILGGGGAIVAQIWLDQSPLSHSLSFLYATLLGKGNKGTPNSCKAEIRNYRLPSHQPRSIIINLVISYSPGGINLF